MCIGGDRGTVVGAFLYETGRGGGYILIIIKIKVHRSTKA
jgi:hypothetical protein